MQWRELARLPLLRATELTSVQLSKPLSLATIWPQEKGRQLRLLR